MVQGLQYINVYIVGTIRNYNLWELVSVVQGLQYINVYIVGTVRNYQFVGTSQCGARSTVYKWLHCRYRQELPLCGN